MTGVVSLELLVERLRWPIARVRLESARQLAELIVGGDEAARTTLLRWAKMQRLESDALILPSLIHAFGLGRYFSFDEVHAAIGSPSVLSDGLLRELFPSSAGRLFSFRYAYSQSAPPPLIDTMSFQYATRHMMPRMFLSSLARLEKSTKLPFLEAWRTEWYVDNLAHPEAFTRYPDFFSGVERGTQHSGDVRQRAVLISAFLRVLAKAMLVWGMPEERALEEAQIALPFIRDLAHFRGSARPVWSLDLLDAFEQEGPKAFARRIWKEAAATLDSGFEVLSLKVVDSDDLRLLEVVIHRAIDADLTDGEPNGAAKVATPAVLFPQGQRWSFDGVLEAEDGSDDGLQPLSVGLMPSAIGRGHTELYPYEMMVADPRLASGEARLICEIDRLIVTDAAGLLSVANLWYADWRPASPSSLSWHGSLTSVRGSALRQFRRKAEVETPRCVRVRFGRREYSHDAFELKTTEFRI